MLTTFMLLIVIGGLTMLPILPVIMTAGVGLAKLVTAAIGNTKRKTPQPGA
jgi:hypothetical protein